MAQPLPPAPLSTPPTPQAAPVATMAYSAAPGRRVWALRPWKVILGVVVLLAVGALALVPMYGRVNRLNAENRSLSQQLQAADQHLQSAQGAIATAEERAYQAESSLSAARATVSTCHSAIHGIQTFVKHLSHGRYSESENEATARTIAACLNGS
jgi:uncharacterized protein HemX